jgi:GNAT superfamily N-acetyltransferase
MERHWRSADSDCRASVGSVRIRPARAEELGELSDLALRSKAVHGYDADFLEACREELTVTPARLADEAILVAEQSGRRLGFVSVAVDHDSAQLVDLFVEPDERGNGVGSLLLETAVETARSAGATRLEIEADPHAEAWYRERGAGRIGEAPSGSIPGRVLPVLELRLPDLVTTRRTDGD